MKRAPRFVGKTHGVVPVRAGTYETPVAYLDAVLAQAWCPGRLPSIERAYDEGRTAELPAILVVFYDDGHANVEDGNHRLTVARARGAERIRVRWVRAPRGARWYETPAIPMAA